MINRVVLVLLAVVASPAAKADPISIGCTDPSARHPIFAKYFATFEIETNRVVFEAENGPVYPGTIQSASNERVEFSVPGEGGILNLTWDRQHNAMDWAGVGHAIRPRIRHPCRVVETRTLLSERDDAPTSPSSPARPFSLRCIDLGRAFYSTLDSHTNKAIMESWGFGGHYRGVISSATEHRMSFSLDVGGRMANFKWDRRDGTVTVEGVPGDPSRPTTVSACTQVALRTVMAHYCRWPGRRDPKLCQEGVR